MTKTRFNSEQLLSRWEDRREVKNLMARLSADFVIKEERGMYGKYWSARPDVCLGLNNGYYSGAEAVKGYYEAVHRYNLLVTELVFKAFPEKFEGKTMEEVYGTGTINYTPLDTGVVEIANDGQTAKGFWTIRGSQVRLTPAGPVSYWEWGWMGADLVKEEDGWKIWHLLHVDDLLVRCGTNWTEPDSPQPYPEVPEFAAIKDFVMPEPNISREVRPLYTTGRPFIRPPEYPEAYETFAETFSYTL